MVNVEEKEIVVKLADYNDADFNRLYKVIKVHEDNITIDVECISETPNKRWQGQNVDVGADTLVGRVFLKLERALFEPFM